MSRTNELVSIRVVELIVVDQNDAPNAQQCKMLRNVTSKPPDAGHSDGDRLQPILSLAAEQADVAIIPVRQSAHE